MFVILGDWSEKDGGEGGGFWLLGQSLFRRKARPSLLLAECFWQRRDFQVADS